MTAPRAPDRRARPDGAVLNMLFEHLSVHIPYAVDAKDFSSAHRFHRAFSSGTSLWSRYVWSFWFTLSILLGSERGEGGCYYL